MTLLFSVYVAAITAGAFSFGVPYFAFQTPEPDLIPRIDRLFRFQVPPSVPRGEGHYFRENRQRTGVNATTVVTLPLQLKELHPEINVGIHTASKATPTVDESGIYVGSDVGWFYAFNFDGSIRWRHYASRSNFGFHSSAAIDQNSVYVGDYFGDITRFDKQTGEVIWIHHVGDALGASPLLDGNGLVANVEISSPPNGFLVRLDRETGQIVWQSLPIGAQSHTSPSYDASNRVMMIGQNTNSIMAFEIWGGRNIWRQKVDNKIKSSFAAVGDSAYFTTWSGTLYSIDVKNGKTRWTFNLKGKSQSSPSWVPDSKLLVVSSLSGIYGITEQGKVRWHYKSNWARGGYPSALVVRRQMQPSTKNQSQYLAWIACGAQKLCAFDGATGKLEASYELPGDLTGSLSAYDGALYFALEDAGLYVLKTK